MAKNKINQSQAGATTLGYAQVTTGQNTTSTSYVQATGLTSTVTIPSGGRNVKITYFSRNLYNGGGNSVYISIWDGTVGSGTQLAETSQATASGTTSSGVCIAVVTPSAGSKTYNIGLKSGSSTTAGFDAAATYPAFMLVELI